MQVKMKAMETTIVDLQEKLNEKDQLLEAKTKATSLMSDSLSKKGRYHYLNITKLHILILFCKYRLKNVCKYLPTGYTY